MRPLEKNKIIANTSKQSKINNNNIKNKNENIYNKNKQYINKVNPIKSQVKNIQQNINPKNRQKPNNLENIDDNINSTSTQKSPPTNQYNNNLLNNEKEREKEREKEKEEYENTKKYINYLKEHLNSSYYANNEINNKNLLLIEKSKSLNEEIKNNSILYEKMKKSFDKKKIKNDEYKNKYEKFLNEQKNNENKNNKLNLEEKIKELKLNKLLINKENQSKEEIIINLKKTLEILEKNKLYKDKEKENKIKELKEEKNNINKLKLNIEKITKELYTKNIKLEEKKKSILFIIDYNDKNNMNNKVPNELLNQEIDKMKTIIENQKLLLNKIKDNQKDIKEKINEQKNLNNKNNKNNINNINNNYTQLLINEKMKNKELLMNLIKSNKEAKDLTTVHNQIKDKYEEDINKIKDEIEKLLKEKNINNNIDYKVVLNQLLEEQKNLKMFNKEFKDKLLIKKAIENKIELMEKENAKLKNKLNNSNNNNIEISENDDEKNENKENNKNKINNIIQENQKEINLGKNKINKDSSIYTITEKGKLLIYNIPNKKFTTANTSSIDYWDIFIKIFLKNYEGSLLLNTLRGLYILTGDNFSDLYYYSQEKNIITKIIKFNYGHKYGGIMISPDQKYLIILGGCDTKEVELLNLENNEIKELPNLLTERINSSYSFIGDNLLYVFFGENNNTIDYLDLYDEKKEWKNINYTNNEIDNIFGHISIPVNENEILIVGGKNNHKMLMFNVKENILEITDNKIPFLDSIGEYLFDKDKYYNNIINLDKKEEKNMSEINQVICMDSQGNIHLFDNDFNYIVLLVNAHEI